MNEVSFFDIDINMLHELTSKISNFIDYGDFIAISGTLGAGKTKIASMIIKNLMKNNNINVTSPTFNILNIYKNNDIEIWHSDLYRIENIDEIYAIGILDCSENIISIIEWPDIVQNILPDNMLKINIEYKTDLLRDVFVSGIGKWVKCFYSLIKN